MITEPEWTPSGVLILGIPSISPLMMVSEVNAYAKYNVSDNAVREFRNPCRNHENVGLMMWAKAQDT